MNEPSDRNEHRDKLLSLYSDLAEVESEIAHLQAEKERIRNEISVLVASAGGRVNIPGIARMELTAPSITVSYDRRAMEAVIHELLARGYGDIAERIIACQKQSQRAGTLRITPERKPQ